MAGTWIREGGDGEVAHGVSRNVCAIGPASLAKSMTWPHLPAHAIGVGGDRRARRLAPPTPALALTPLAAAAGGTDLSVSVVAGFPWAGHAADSAVARQRDVGSVAQDPAAARRDHVGRTEECRATCAKTGCLAAWMKATATTLCPWRSAASSGMLHPSRMKLASQPSLVTRSCPWPFVIGRGLAVAVCSPTASDQGSHWARLRPDTKCGITRANGNRATQGLAGACEYGKRDVTDGADVPPVRLRRFSKLGYSTLR